MTSTKQFATNGKELKVLSGSIVMFLFVPFERSEKTTLDQEASEFIEVLKDKINNLIASLRESLGMRATDRSFVGLEDVQVEIRFNRLELQYLELCLRETIREDKLFPKKSNNVYFGGDRYGISPGDFDTALEKVRDLMNQETIPFFDSSD